jgi:hypothetical protein
MAVRVPSPRLIESLYSFFRMHLDHEPDLHKALNDE